MKKVVVAMPTDDRLQKQLLQELRKVDWLDADCDVDFVHIFKQENYPYMVPPTIYPNSEQRVEITKTLTQIFEGLTSDLRFRNKKFHVDYHETPKEGMVKYLTEHKADLVITLTRKRHSFADYFSSTFTEFLIKHAPCGVLVMRHDED